MSKLRRLQFGSTFQYYLDPSHPLIKLNPRVELCKERNEGFVCTLEAGHLGAHEAHDAGGICQHSWKGYHSC